jgi:hypothetical protein
MTKLKRFNMKIVDLVSFKLQETFDYKVKSEISFDLSKHLYWIGLGSLIKTTAEGLQ